MTSPWTVQQVQALAPDSASASAGMGLAKPAKWVTLGRSDRALWGELQGSGKEPYRTRIDQAGPAFKCSCPSRKFPCKHGLGLLFICAQNAAAVTEQPEPAWVSEWLDQRANSEQAKAQKAADRAAKPVDPQQQQKRIDAREAKVAAGLDELELFLRDLTRQGLAGTQARDTESWRRLRARMVDAQATGLAREIDLLHQTVGVGHDWQSRSLLQLGRLWLLITGYRNQASLPDPLRQEVRTLIGWTADQAAVEAGEKTADTWLVLSRELEESDNLITERVWLWGKNTRQYVYTLAFKAGAGPAKWLGLVPGTQFDSGLPLFPGLSPRRALAPQGHTPTPINVQPEGHANIASLLGGHADALAQNPFIRQFPATLDSVTLQGHVDSQTNRWILIDSDGSSLSVAPESTSAIWDMLSVSDGGPMKVFGVLDADRFSPLGCWDSRGYLWTHNEPEAKVLMRSAVT
jgi:hypothetical protein